MKKEEFLINYSEFKKDKNKAREGLFAQGNGYLFVRGSFEEGILGADQSECYTRTMKSVTTEIPHEELSKWGTYVPIIMGNHPFLGEVIINLPYFMDMRFMLDSELVDMGGKNISDFVQHMDIAVGTLYRSFTVTGKEGLKIKFEFERFPSLSQKHLFVQRCTYKVLEGEGCVGWEAGIDTSVTTNGYNHFMEKDFQTDGMGIEVHIKTDTGFKVVTRSNVQGSLSMGAVSFRNKKGVYFSNEKKVRKGDKEELVKLTAVTTRRDLEEGSEKVRAYRILEDAKGRSYEELYRENENCWEKKWEKADIKIEGNKDLQKKIRFALYHLIRSGCEEEERVQICAKGFAGEAYYGRYFWDSEIYLLPFYLYTNPKVAKNFLMYRYHMLDGARKNAKRYHSKGARYPWQSGLTGEEQCSLWEYADNEIHVTADIAFAIMKYYEVTDDYEFMRDCGLEILLETARFFADRTDRTEDGYHLLNVMGPDEYSAMTSDNCFTNYMVKHHLSSAVSMAVLVKRDSPEQFERLKQKIQWEEEEASLFLEIAESLPLPYDKQKKLYLQSSDFYEYGDIDIDGIWKDKSRPFGFFISQEKLYRSKCLKQADVIALMSLFPERFTQEEMEQAYNYYMPLTTHDSSLSPAGHSLIANRLHRKEDVKHFLNQALKVDFDFESGHAGEGIHIANCGCIWQLFIMGFAGFSYDYKKKEATFCPELPDFIDGLEFRLCINGIERQVKIEKETLKFTMLCV